MITNNNYKFGIINFSNNCYLNVIIQLFLYNKNSSNIILHHLDIIKNNNNFLINPNKLMKKLSDKIDVTIQNDAQEIFTLILDLLPNLEKFYINKIKYVYKCQECNKSRKQEDIFTTFYIHDNSLEKSVKQTISNEKFILECDFCKQKTLTSKTCKINQLGDILIFYNILKKKLDITDNIKFGNKIYKLSGIIKHFGNSMNGHYIFIDYINKLIIDDNNIKKLDSLTMDNIYLLFYT